MRGNRGRDTKPELALRRLLHARGLRYRVDFRPLPAVRRRADVVFTRARVAVFVDGCYWHGCPQHGTQPKTNAQYWAAKIETNQARDRDTDEQLARAGWLVVRFWEHTPAESAAERVAELVAERTPAVSPRSAVEVRCAARRAGGFAGRERDRTSAER